MEPVLDPLSLTICLVVVLVTYLYMYGTGTYDYWKVRGIPYLKPLPFLGNQLFMFTDSKTHIDFIGDMYKKFDQARCVGFFKYREPVLLVRDPEMLNEILVASYHDFHSRGMDLDFEQNALSPSLVQLEGAMWKLLRKTTSPVFTLGKLKMMFGEIDSIALDLVRFLEQQMSSAPLEVRGLMAQFSTKVIGSVAFGVDMDILGDPDSEFMKYAPNAFIFDARRIAYELLSSVCPKLRNFLGLKIFNPDRERFFIDFTKKAVEVREKKVRYRNDLLQHLMDMKVEEGVKKPQDNEAKDTGVFQNENLLPANVFIFFFAGVDTTTLSLGHLLLELALHPEIQDKAREEIMIATNNTENVTYEIVQGMKYLDQVISENLRKHTPLLYFTRKVTRDYRIPGTDVILNKNVGIIIPSYAIHNDPKYYPEPRKFDPERFSEQNALKLKKFTYMPFGGGPRHCVAKRFALLEQKITLTRLLPRFRFGLCEKTEYPLDYEPSTMFPIPKKGIWLKVERLQK